MLDGLDNASIEMEEAKVYLLSSPSSAWWFCILYCQIQNSYLITLSFLHEVKFFNLMSVHL